MKQRIQVSIHGDLVSTAERLMAQRHFVSFSEYLEHLIREEHERRGLATSSASVAGQILSDAVSAAAATPAPAPATYQSPIKPARPTKPRSAPASRKK